MKKVKCKYPLVWKLGTTHWAEWDGAKLSLGDKEEGNIVVLKRASVRKLYQKISGLYKD